MFGVNRSYVSEFGVWMKSISSSHSEWRVAQNEGRAQAWDIKRDFKAEADRASGDIQQLAYPYDVNFPPA